MWGLAYGVTAVFCVPAPTNPESFDEIAFRRILWHRPERNVRSPSQT